MANKQRTIRSIYLAGPMRGYANYNFPSFWRAAHELRTQGYHVVSPAELDQRHRQVTVVDPRGDIFDNENPLDCGWADEDLEKFTVICTDLTQWKFMRRDLPEVCRVDAILLLPGWKDSEGANKELAVARWTGRMLGEYTDGGITWNNNLLVKNLVV